MNKQQQRLLRARKRNRQAHRAGLCPWKRPAILPPGWVLNQEANDGALYDAMDGPDRGLRVIASAALEEDGKWWLHVSASRYNRLPSWEDLRRVKDIFVGPNAVAYQVLPMQSEYVNINPFVLHLWHCLDQDPLPDFTWGSGGL
jgi:hypothetical protein